VRIYLGEKEVESVLIVCDSFMAHPETLLPMPEIDDPVERFVSVVKFYLSGWHIKPPYVLPRREALNIWLIL
jgi:hypothetical protein